MARREDPDRISLPQGALELLILRVLAREASHGYAISREVHRLSEEALGVEEGSLYPALHRMERRGWVSAEWGISGTGRRAKVYRLTDEGTERLKRERRAWERMTGAVGRVLEGRPEGA